jgi:hypothetical protein
MLMRYAAFAIGHVLTPDELRLIGVELFGEWGWQTRLSEALEVDGSTVRRWVSGAVSVPNPVKVALRLMVEQKRGLRAPAPIAPSQAKLPAKRRS